ncbi:phospholipid-transporting ATPase ABCA3 [Rhipicephalus microplus]|uniref:phospholipid-transporting ATPase ABCA3 n=1 Tax=Rhipicephalus microplus TaxID=6941 RepID=UPI003F6B3C28
MPSIFQGHLLQAVCWQDTVVPHVTGEGRSRRRLQQGISMGVVNQLYTIVWKDVYVQAIKRHYYVTALEVVLIILSFFAVEHDRPILPTKHCDKPPCLHYSEPREYHERDLVNFSCPQLVLYAPRKIGDKLFHAAFKDNKKVRVVGFETAGHMLSAFHKVSPKPNRGPEQRVVAVTLDQSGEAGSKLGLAFSVSFYDEFEFMSKRLNGYALFEPLPNPVTQRESVACLQLALGQAHLASVAAETTYAEKPYNIVTHRTTEGPYPLDMPSHRWLMLIRLGVGYLVPFCLILSRVVEETQQGMREKLRLVGLRAPVYRLGHWMAGFFSGLVSVVMVMAYMTAVENTGDNGSQASLDDTSKPVVLICFALFTAQYISKAMLIALFFRDTVLGVVFAVVYWHISYVMPCILLEDMQGRAAHYILLDRWTKLLTSTLPCVGMHWCFRIIGCANVVGEQYAFTSTTSSVLELDNVTMVEIWSVMLIDSIVNIILGWYLSHVLTWYIGVPYVPWFPLTYQYWFATPKGKFQPIQPSIPDGVHFETYPVDKEEAVFVNKLEYEKKQKHVLRDTSFKAYQGEIMVILGPSGAGKTALVNIISGSAVATQGQVIVNGYDVAVQTARARQTMGVVQQRDVLFYDLTVAEHLVFFGALAGLSGEALLRRCVELQDMFSLVDIAEVRTNLLAEAQKRRLAIAIAIVVPRKVLILDEPVRGMDAASRMNVWQVLDKLRPTTCIIITTPEVEAVEVIADRIAVLGYGALKCCGRTGFLQRRYGTGYNVTIQKGPKFETKRTLQALQVNVVTMQDVFTRLILELDAANVESRRRAASLARRSSLKSHTGAATEFEYSQRDIIPTENLGGVSEVEEYESSVQIEQHLKSIFDLKASTPTFVQTLAAMIEKRRNYTWQTFALPVLCWLLPAALMFVECQSEKRLGNQLAVSFAGDRMTYDLPLLHPGSTVFVSADKASEPFKREYRRYLDRQDTEVKDVTNVQGLMMEFKKSRTAFREYMAGAEFQAGPDNNTAGKAVAWYNGDSYHTQSASLAAVGTALLRKISGDDDAMMVTVLRPLRTDNDTVASHGAQNLRYADELSALLSSRVLRMVLLPATTSVVAASFVLFPIEDRVTNSKTMQLVSGVHPFIYWLGNYVWDMVLSLGALLVLFIPMFICHSEFMSIAITMVMVFLSYVHSILALTYWFSFVTDSVISGFLIVNAINALSGTVSTMGYQLVMIAQEQGSKHLISLTQPWDPLLMALYLLPPFSYTWAITKVAQKVSEDRYCQGTTQMVHDVCAYLHNSPDEGAVLLTNLRYCCATFYASNGRTVSHLSPFAFHRDAVLVELLVMLVEGFLLLVLLGLLEHGMLRWFRSGSQTPAAPAQGLREGVAEERKVVEKILAGNDFTKPRLVILDIRQNTNNRQVLRGLTFHVDPGETFVVLGLRGCGKTTLLDILSGVLPPTSGTALIGHTLLSNTSAWQQRIGVCPHYDGVLGRLTVRQTLTLYARVRGMTGDTINKMLEHMISLLNLGAVVDNTVDSTSAVTRRKLAVAIAIVGLPPVVLMNDPATGLDTISKRKIYRSIQILKQMAKSAILIVTQSVSDCVVISDRMAIMLNGQFQCLGSIGDLRKRYCKGSMILVKLKPSVFQNTVIISTIHTQVQAAFPGSVYMGRLSMALEYSTELKMPWSTAVVTAHNLKQQLSDSAIDVILSDVSMEHVLLKMAKYEDVKPVAVAVA